MKNCHATGKRRPSLEKKGKACLGRYLGTFSLCERTSVRGEGGKRTVSRGETINNRALRLNKQSHATPPSREVRESA